MPEKTFEELKEMIVRAILELPIHEVPVLSGKQVEDLGPWDATDIENGGLNDRQRAYCAKLTQKLNFITEDEIKNLQVRPGISWEPNYGHITNITDIKAAALIERFITNIDLPPVPDVNDPNDLEHLYLTSSDTDARYQNISYMEWIQLSVHKDVLIQKAKDIREYQQKFNNDNYIQTRNAYDKALKQTNNELENNKPLLHPDGYSLETILEAKKSGRNVVLEPKNITLPNGIEYAGLMRIPYYGIVIVFDMMMDAVNAMIDNNEEISDQIKNELRQYGQKIIDLEREFHLGGTDNTLNAKLAAEKDQWDDEDNPYKKFELWIKEGKSWGLTSEEFEEQQRQEEQERIEQARQEEERKKEERERKYKPILQYELRIIKDNPSIYPFYYGIGIQETHYHNDGEEYKIGANMDEGQRARFDQQWLNQLQNDDIQQCLRYRTFLLLQARKGIMNIQDYQDKGPILAHKYTEITQEEQERQGQQRIAREAQERLAKEQERIEQERIAKEQERIEQERIAKEQERIEQERIDQENMPKTFDERKMTPEDLNKAREQLLTTIFKDAGKFLQEFEHWEKNNPLEDANLSPHDKKIITEGRKDLSELQIKPLQELMQKWNDFSRYVKKHGISHETYQDYCAILGHIMYDLEKILFYSDYLASTNSLIKNNNTSVVSKNFAKIIKNIKINSLILCATFYDSLALYFEDTDTDKINNTLTILKRISQDLLSQPNLSLDEVNTRVHHVIDGIEQGVYYLNVFNTLNILRTGLIGGEYNPDQYLSEYPCAHDVEKVIELFIKSYLDKLIKGEKIEKPKKDITIKEESQEIQEILDRKEEIVQKRKKIFNGRVNLDQISTQDKNAVKELDRENTALSTKLAELRKHKTNPLPQTEISDDEGYETDAERIANSNNDLPKESTPLFPSDNNEKGPSKSPEPPQVQLSQIQPSQPELSQEQPSDLVQSKQATQKNFFTKKWSELNTGLALIRGIMMTLLIFSIVFLPLTFFWRKKIDGNELQISEQNSESEPSPSQGGQKANLEKSSSTLLTKHKPRLKI